MTIDAPPRTEARPAVLALLAVVGAGLLGMAGMVGAQPSGLLIGQRDGSTGSSTPTVTFETSAEGAAAIDNLDPGLLDALRRAATDAARDGVVFHVNSGWRSAEHQEQLLRDAIDEYGSEEEASRWVATPETSVHVSGEAVDIGPRGAAAWLSGHGPDYGLCQVYDNEPWHYELRPEAADHGCPSTYADPSHDPRMQP